MNYKISITSLTTFRRSILNKPAVDIISFCKLNNELSQDSLINKPHNVICSILFLGNKSLLRIIVLDIVVLEICKYFTCRKPKSKIITNKSCSAHVYAAYFCLQYSICPSF